MKVTLNKEEKKIVYSALYQCLVGCGSDVDFNKKEEKILKKLLKKMDK